MKKFAIALMAALTIASPAMAQDSSIAERASQIVASQLGIDRSLVSADKTFGQLGADDMSIAGIYMTAEQNFGVELPVIYLRENPEINGAITVGNLIADIEAAAGVQPIHKPSHRHDTGKW